jgi:metal-dependent amidase/aminoacylase/carboxypeptidase family protein
LRSRLEDLVSSLARAHGAEAAVVFIEGEPAVINDPDMTGLIATAARGLAGEGAVVAAPGWAAADDFGFYSERLPSVYFRLGVMRPDAKDTYALHHPKFQIDEAALSLGAATVAAAALSYLDRP